MVAVDAEPDADVALLDALDADVEGFTVYGNDNSIYQYISDTYPEDEIQFDISKIKLITLDIEVASENGFPDVKNCDEEILLITIQDYTTKEIITWGSRPFTKKFDNYHYILCNDEQHLLNSFLDYWSNNTPEVITGWNVEFYDIPYIVGRINRVLNEKAAKRLTAWNFIREKQTEVRGEIQTTYELSGISILDYLDLYRKYSFKNPENYRLDTLTHVVEPAMGGYFKYVMDFIMDMKKVFPTLGDDWGMYIPEVKYPDKDIKGRVR